MEYTAEERFVRSFLRKSRRQRLLHELTTPKKRYEGISRFCHQARELLDPSKIVLEGEDLDRRPEFARFVRVHGEVCLVLSPCLPLEGQLLPFREAVSLAALLPDAALILGGTFAVVFGEPGKGGRGKYLLSER